MIFAQDVASPKSQLNSSLGRLVDAKNYYAKNAVIRYPCYGTRAWKEETQKGERWNKQKSWKEPF